MFVLVLNAGSSTQKSCLYRLEGDALPDEPPAPVWEGKIEWGRPEGASLTVRTAGGAERRETIPPDTSRPDGLAHLLETLWSGDGAPLGGPDEINVVGHRVVHGGRELREPVQLTQEAKDAIRRAAELAPEHNPAAIEGIEGVEQRLGADIPQLAVFDTAFHATIPEAAAVYPIPYEWTEQDGIRRYGFHGINHEWCAGRAGRILAGRDPASLRLISCHLGNGCSLAAIRGGKSVDTTMGFTPLEGLMMGSRSGSVDPGALLHLLKRDGAPSPADLDRILNKESGLKGVSGVSSDMRDVTATAEKGDERARLALEVYVHRLRWHIGAMLASLGSLDAIVFTAGVGENRPDIRAAACEPFAAMLGIRIDEEKNRQARPPGEWDVSAPDSAVRVLMIPAQEDWAIARHCWRLLHNE